jgi:hypothetical protein
VRSCRLASLPPELVRLAGPSITAVDLTGNHLAALPAADLSALRHTRELRVGGNRLAALPESIRSLAGLTGLYAPDNRLTTLPATLAWLSVLTALDLDGNRRPPSPPPFSPQPPTHPTANSKRLSGKGVRALRVGGQSNAARVRVKRDCSGRWRRVKPPCRR